MSCTPASTFLSLILIGIPSFYILKEQEVLPTQNNFEHKFTTFCQEKPECRLWLELELAQYVDLRLFLLAKADADL